MRDQKGNQCKATAKCATGKVLEPPESWVMGKVPTHQAGWHVLQQSESLILLSLFSIRIMVISLFSARKEVRALGMSIWKGEKSWDKEELFKIPYYSKCIALK